MDSIQHIIDQVPLRYNLISFIIITGIIQGFLVCSIIAIKTNRKNAALRIFGWAVFFQSIISLDIYLCYTGLMKYSLHFNDSTEPLVLLIGPLLFLFFSSLLDRKKITFKKHWYHFLIPFIYFLSQTGYYLQPVQVKLNAYLGAFFSTIEFAPVPENTNYSYHIIKDEFRWILLFSFLLYIILSIRIVLKARMDAYKSLRINKYKFTRNAILIFLCVFLLVLFIYLNFDDDGGDHYIAVFLSLINYFTVFFMILESRFFENSWISDKYETSGLNPKTSVLIRDIDNYVKSNLYFLNEDASLKDLSGKLETSVNYISQAINSSQNINFNEYINRYRIEEAKNRLLHKDYAHLSVVGIGNSVGFKSKSAFYNAFKKHTQTSPASFVNRQKEKNAQ
ncbi:helix-turn-helix domain-containing protein [Flavobacteriaceae bacterium R38]|nr:helix-turn-helix domain-containing protein [Flavobacteriaceae bacterium R38]